MFNVTKKPEGRIDIEISGAINSEAMREGLDQLLEATEDVEHGVMLYRITDFSLPTLGALSVELQKLPELFGLIGKIDRCAVVTDQGWIRTAAEIEGAVIPGLDIKAFRSDDAANAETWLLAE